MRLEELAAREQFAREPLRFWHWFYFRQGEPDMSDQHRWLLQGLGAGYRRSSCIEPLNGERLKLFSRTLLWYLWSHPKGFVYWPSLCPATDGEIMDSVSKEIESSNQFLMRREFTLDKQKNMIGRSYEDNYCACPLTEGEVIGIEGPSLRKSPVLFLIPELEALQTRFVRQICAKLQSSDRAQIAAISKHEKVATASA